MPADIDRFISLTSRKRELNEQVNQIQKEIDELSSAITAEFRDNNKQAETRSGYTVYLSRDVSVKSTTGDTADVVDKLRKARLGELIGICHPRLKSFVKERMFNAATETWEIDMTKLPPSLRDVVAVEEYFRLNCRKA